MGRVAVREANWKLNCGQNRNAGNKQRFPAPGDNLWTEGERTALRTASLLPPMKLELTSSRDKADKAVPRITGGRGSAPFACQALVGIDSTGVLKKSILPAPKW